MDRNWQTRTRKSAVGGIVPSTSKSLLKRKCACGQSAGSGTECDLCKKKELQRKSAGTAGPAIAPPIVHEVLSSPGEPLEASARVQMEKGFDYDFSHVPVHPRSQSGKVSELTIAPPDDALEQQADRTAHEAMRPSDLAAHSGPGPQGTHFNNVRVHTGARAAESAQAVNALAYTVGNHIVFGANQYQPASAKGQELLAHELAHVAQQRELSDSPGVQRKVAVDPKKFTGATATKDLADFEKMILDELKPVTGMNLNFSSDVLAASGKPSGGSATAQQVLNMAMNEPGTIFMDPMPGLGGHPTARGVEIGTGTPGVMLKAFRTGIIILHELTHFLANKLKPADYDKKMKQLEADQKAGKTLTPEEQEQLMQYNPNTVTSDENIAVMIENKIQQESGTIQRIHYGIQIEFPPKPGKKGPDAWTTYAVFKTGDKPPLFFYLDAGTYDLYSSTVDYFDELVKAGQPVAPKAGAMTKIVKGTPAYQAVQKHLL